MNQKTNNRMQMLTAMAIFIAAVFIWGIVQWQATGVKEPAVQKALATQKKVNNVSDKKVNIEALTKILLQDIKYETKLNLMDDSVVEGIVSLQKAIKLSGTSTAIQSLRYMPSRKHTVQACTSL